MKSLIFCLATLAFVVPCRGQNPPFRLPNNIEIQTNVTYVAIGSRKLHLDLFLPRVGTGPFPAVVYIHGGGWIKGDKSQFWRQAADMASKGFVGATIEYRLSTEAKYPAALYDSKAAVRWLRAHAAKYHVDPNRIAAAGGSAGGYLVAMLGTTAGMPRFDGKEGNSRISTRVAAVAAFNPVLNLVYYGKRDPKAASSFVVRFLGVSYAKDPELWKEASPINHASASSAPTLFLHGTADTTVPFQQSVDMMDKLKAAGVRAELFPAPGANHGFFNQPPWFEPTLMRMEEFFTALLKPAT